MFRVVFVLSGLFSISSYTLFDTRDALFSESVDVRLIRRSKRDEKSDGMPSFYDVKLPISGKHVRTRLKLYEDSLVTDRKSWAGYRSEDLSGIFIVRRENITDVQIEGFFVHDEVQYLIQPDDANGGHVLHAISKSNSSILRPELSSHFDLKRSKRDNDLLKKHLHFKCQVVFDHEALRFAAAKLRQLKKDAMAETFLLQFAVVTEIYVEEAFKSLSRTLRMSFSIAPSIEIRKEPIPGLGKMKRTFLNDHRRLTACVERTLEAVVHFYDDWKNHEHLLIFTGYQLLGTHGVPQFTASNDAGKVCTRMSVSVVEFNFNIKSLRGVAQMAMASMGVDMDGGPNPKSAKCPASDGYIMSQGDTTDYVTGPNVHRYSKCTSDMLKQFLVELSPEMYALTSGAFILNDLLNATD